MRIGFIGMGKMGSGMARSLLRAGHQVTVFNRTPEKAEALAENGARVSASVAGACAGAQAVITMLADDSAVEQAVFRVDGIADALEHGAVHISSSTIGTALVRRLAAEHDTRGQGFLSAPVFGRPEAAEAAKLIVVAAGPDELVERCRPIFEAIGRQTAIPGPQAWQANAVKLCGNFMIAGMIEAFGEAYALLRKAAVEPHLFLEVMNGLFGSPVYANYGSMIADARFEPAGFALKLGMKDMRLALETSQECASPMPLASLIRDHFISAAAHRQSEWDWSSLAQVSARAAGL